MLLPPVSNALRIAAGLPARVFVGASASTRNLAAKRAFASRVPLTPALSRSSVDELAEQQILLSQQEVRRILLIGRIGEPFVATGDRDGTGIVTADRSFAGGSKRPCRTPGRRVLAAMIPAGFFSVITVAASSSRIRRPGRRRR